MLSSMHTRLRDPRIGLEQQWMVRVANSLLSLSILMTNLTSHTGIAVEMWATPKRPAVRGHPEPFKLPATSLPHPSPSIQMTTFTSPITILATKTCTISQILRVLGLGPSLRILDGMLLVCPSILLSIQLPINPEFLTLTQVQPASSSLHILHRKYVVFCSC